MAYSRKDTNFTNYSFDSKLNISELVKHRVRKGTQGKTRVLASQEQGRRGRSEIARVPRHDADWEWCKER